MDVCDALSILALHLLVDWGGDIHFCHLKKIHVVFDNFKRTFPRNFQAKAVTMGILVSF